MSTYMYTMDQDQINNLLILLLISSEIATGGRSDIPYDNIESIGIRVYGMPAGVPFHSPLLYNQQQLQQILANIEKIAFIKTSSESAARDVSS